MINGWAYSNEYVVGNTVTQYRTNESLTIVRVGGWVDFEIDIPDTYSELRLQNIVITGAVHRHDIAMWEIELTRDDV